MSSTRALDHMSILLSLLLLLHSSLVSAKVKMQEFGDFDFGLETPQVIESRGFEYELHKVVTLDGYILAVHRIVHPHLNCTRGSVLFMHGIGLSSVNFLVTGAGGYIDEPLGVIGANSGFELAKHGYDVWLLDQRGTPFSSGHLIFDADRDKSYYDFSLDDFALTDLPAVIDYMMLKTGRPRIGYIGHSQGSTIMFMLLSRIHKYNDIIYPFIALAPVFRLDYAYPNLFPINVIQLKGLTAKVLVEKGGKLVNDRVGRVIEGLCTPEQVRSTLCILFLSLFNALIGFGPLNKERSPIGYTGAYFTISAWQAAQFLQIARQRRVQMTDFGPDRNMKVYGQVRPPAYNAGRITNKHIAFFTAEKDLYSDTKDVAILKSLLKVQPFYEQTVQDPRFAHIAFVCGKSDLASEYVNKPLLKVMNALYPWDHLYHEVADPFTPLTLNEEHHVTDHDVTQGNEIDTDFPPGLIPDDLMHQLNLPNFKQDLDDIKKGVPDAETMMQDEADDVQEESQTSFKKQQQQKQRPQQESKKEEKAPAVDPKSVKGSPALTSSEILQRLRERDR